MLLGARLLALITQLAGGLKNPPGDCLILARQLTHSVEIPRLNEMRVVEKGERQVQALANQPGSIAGISSEKGEVHLYFRENFRRKLAVVFMWLFSYVEIQTVRLLKLFMVLNLLMGWPDFTIAAKSSIRAY